MIVLNTQNILLLSHQYMLDKDEVKQNHYNEKIWLFSNLNSSILYSLYQLSDNFLLMNNLLVVKSGDRYGDRYNWFIITNTSITKTLICYSTTFS